MAVAAAAERAPSITWHSETYYYIGYIYIYPIYIIMLRDAQGQTGLQTGQHTCLAAHSMPHLQELKPDAAQAWGKLACQ